MRRREFLGGLGGTLGWPLAVRAQQEHGRRIGLLLPATAGDTEYIRLVAAFTQTMRQLGWTDGGNVRFEIRWAGANADSNRRHAAELVALAPEVIVSSGAASTGPILQTTRTIPVIFAIVPDPVGAGFVDSLARPGGNTSGFTSFEYGIGGK